MIYSYHFRHGEEKRINIKIVLPVSAAAIPYSTECAIHILTWFIDFESFKNYCSAFFEACTGRRR
jgi:hypothetical protein